MRTHQHSSQRWQLNPSRSRKCILQAHPERLERLLRKPTAVGTSSTNSLPSPRQGRSCEEGEDAFGWHRNPASESFEDPGLYCRLISMPSSTIAVSTHCRRYTLPSPHKGLTATGIAGRASLLGRRRHRIRGDPHDTDGNLFVIAIEMVHRGANPIAVPTHCRRNSRV